jgi:flagellar hook protein FlgE
MNTPGFKGAHVDFADLFSGDGGDLAAGQRGVDASQVSLDMRAGEIRQTGRDLDLALNGNGFFVMRDEEGTLHYTRNGGFEFNDAGVLVGRGNGMRVMALDANGRLVEVTLEGRRTNVPAVTTEVMFTGTLSSTDTDHAIEDVAVFDALGGRHTVRMTFTNDNANTPGSWIVTVFEGQRELGRGNFVFEDGRPTTSRVSVSLGFDGVEPMNVELALDADVNGFSLGTTSTLSMRSQNGHEAGNITTLTFDENGVLKIGYSNGQSVDGEHIALAEVTDDAGLVATGSATYTYSGASAPTLRQAGDDLRITTKSIENSNVDLTSEFSALILMQRGYQASSQVVSTANEMLQQLFEMKGGR